jgi:serine protease Do
MIKQFVTRVFPLICGLSLIIGCEPIGLRLKDLIAEKNFEQAAQHYSDHRDFFKGAETDYADQLQTVAKNLNQSHEAALRASANKLDQQNWPTEPLEWPTIQLALREATQVIAGYDKNNIVTERPFRSPTASQLDKLLSEFTAKVRSDAAVYFPQFNHFGEKSFFDSFPVLLDAKSIMSQNFPALQPQLQTASTKELQRFVKLYPKDQILDQAALTQISNEYLRAHLTENTQGDSRNLSTNITALNAVREQGFPANSFPELRVAFMEEEFSASRANSLDVPIRFDLDLPVVTGKEGLKEILQAVRPKTDFLILVDVAFATVRHKSEKVESVKSEYLSGYRTDPNPNYYITQSKVEAERVNVASVKLRNALNPCIYCGWGALIVHALAQGIAVGAAEGRLNKAVEELKEVPPNIEVPLYQEYSFRKVLLESTKTVAINCFVIDFARQTSLNYSFDQDEKKQFQVIYELHDKDRQRHQSLKGAVTEKDISAWEQSPLNISLSSILREYIRTGGNAQTELPASLVEIQLVAERNRVLKEKKAGISESVSISDPRFETVVVVYNRQKGTLGSGFFVKSDIVLTNYHVVRDATYIEMKTHGGEETFGKVMKYDARLDLALVKVQRRGKPAEFYDESVLNVGSTVEAIGHPKGLEFSITRGVISAVRKQPSLIVPGTGEILTIQTDTTLNVGNSGGPLFVGQKVIGVVSYGLKSPTLEGLNFAIHYTEVNRFLAENLSDH